MFELMKHLYKEQVRRRDGATGRILAASDLFEPMVANALRTGYANYEVTVTGR